MFGLENPIHILFVLVVLLLVFGAKRLPEMGKSMGEGLHGFTRAIRGETLPESLAAVAPAVTEQPAAAATETTTVPV
jgi:sec-independent protein translocase protein TatA